MGAFATHMQIRGRSFITAAPYGFVDRDGRLGEGAIIDKYWHVRDGDVVFDVGACYGLYTLPSCALGAFVYAVEPNEPSCVALEHLLDINGFTDRCRVIRGALSDKEGEHPADLRACVDPFFFGNPRITTLDNVVEALKVPRVDWIKVDVEGGELCVVEGAIQTIKRHRPTLLIEDHTGVPMFAKYCKGQRTRARIGQILAAESYAVVEEPFEGRDFIIGWPREAPPFLLEPPEAAGAVQP